MCPRLDGVRCAHTSQKLVLPKAPHGFAVTGFLLGCLGKRACHAPTKKALNTSCWGLCAQDWITFSDPLRLTRGLTNKKVPARFAHHGIFSVRSPKQASVAAIKKSRTSCRTFLFVPKTGFEPARRFQRYHLKVVRLPISPPGQMKEISAQNRTRTCTPCGAAT